MQRLGQAEWEGALSRFTDDQVQRALRQMRGEYPPSLPQLEDACRVLPCHRPLKALPKPRADKVVALTAIQSIKAKLSA